MKIYTKISTFVLFAAMISFTAFHSANNSNLRPEDIRPYHNDYGFAVDNDQFAKTTQIAKIRESESLKGVSERVGLSDGNLLHGAICPHDDYAYASQVYIHVMPYIKAKTVIIFGVAHKAKDYNLSDKLIFCNYKAWSTPLGDLKVSSLREDIINSLVNDEYVINSEFMYVEHSIEAVITWLKYYNPDAEIIPICVPYMKWERLDYLSNRFATILSRLMGSNNLEIGKDVAILISNDAVHYGDQGWGGKNYAPFGAHIKGYLQGTTRDLTLAKKYLQGKLELSRLEDLYYELVEKDDPYQYRITWCGRFCLPFGLAVLTRINQMLSKSEPDGYILRYDTSVGLGLIEDVNPPLEVTAPANLHHWVAYLAMGFW